MDKYENILKNQIWASMLGIVLVLILSATMIILNKKHLFDELGKIGKFFVSTFIVLIIISAGAYFSLRISHLYTDIQEQAYITYVGEFEVSPYNDRHVTLQTESTSLSLDGKVDLPSGKHFGKIVYAKNSKRILDWQAY